MRAGFAEVDITPRVGSVLGGFIARTRPSAGVDRPLSIRALYLEENGVRGLLIGLDVLGLSTACADRLVAQLAAEFNLSEHEVVLACSHTHSGPMTLAMRGIGPADEEYLGFLERRALCAAAIAIEGQSAVRASWGRAPLSIGVNRRQTVHTSAGRSVILGSNPDGPADREVRVLKLTGRDRPILLFEYACHPYCLGGDTVLISSDFWGHAAASLCEAGFDCLYLNGCSGNIAPVLGFGGPDAARTTGGQLADAVMAAQAKARPAAFGLFRIASQRFEIPLDCPPNLDRVRSELDRADHTVREVERSDPEVQRRIRQAWSAWIAELEAILTRGPELPPAPARVSVVSIGGGAIVALPGEIFYETGRGIAARLSADPVCVAAYAHGYIGYVPTLDAFAEGGYEVDEAHRYLGLWRVSPSAAERIERHVIELWTRNGGQLR